MQSPAAILTIICSLCICAAASAAIVPSNSGGAVVQTECGTITGIEGEIANQYLGIPFAVPPQRWRVRLGQRYKRAALTSELGTCSSSM